MGKKFGTDIAWALLEAAVDGVEIVQRGCYQPSALLRYGLQDLRTLEAERLRRKMRNTMFRLKRKGYVIERRKADKRAFLLTELGKKALKNRSLLDFAEKLPHGDHFIVSFDIPERYRSARDAFRHYLKFLQFTQVHKSVWYIDRDLSAALSAKMRELQVGSWVVLCRGKIQIF